jgi:hypothetical protein
MSLANYMGYSHSGQIDRDPSMLYNKYMYPPVATAPLKVPSQLAGSVVD